MHRRDIIVIEGERLEIVSGGIVKDLHLGRVDAVEHRPWMIFTSVPSFGRREVQWIVKGRGRARITFDSLKTRNRSITVDL